MHCVVFLLLQRRLALACVALQLARGGISVEQVRRVCVCVCVCCCVLFASCSIGGSAAWSQWHSCGTGAPCCVRVCVCVHVPLMCHV